MEIQNRQQIIIDTIRNIHPSIDSLLNLGGIVFGGIITRAIEGYVQNLADITLKQYILDYLKPNEDGIFEHDIDVSFYSDKIKLSDDAYNIVAEIFGVEHVELRNENYDLGEFARYICYADNIKFDITFIDNVERTYNFNPRFSVENLLIEKKPKKIKKPENYALSLFYEHVNCKSVDEVFDHIAEKILIIVEPSTIRTAYSCSPVRFIWRVAKKYFFGKSKLSEDYYTKRIIAERIQTCLEDSWYKFEPYGATYDKKTEITASQLIYNFITAIERRKYTQNIDISSLEPFLIKYDKKKWLLKLQKYLNDVKNPEFSELPKPQDYFREDIRTIIKYVPEIFSDTINELKSYAPLKPIICKENERSPFDLQRMLYAYALLDLESKFVVLLLDNVEFFVKLHVDGESPNVFTALFEGANIKYLKYLRTNNFNIILDKDTVRHIIENGNEETLQYMMDCEQTIVNGAVTNIDANYLKTLKKLRMFHVKAILAGTPTGSPTYQPVSQYPKTVANDNNFIEYSGIELTTYELIKMSRKVKFGNLDECLEYLDILKNKPLEHITKHGVPLQPYKHSEIWDINTCIFGSFGNFGDFEISEGTAEHSIMYVSKYVDYLLERHPHEDTFKSSIMELLLFVYTLKIQFVEACGYIHSYKEQKVQNIDSLYELIESVIFEQFSYICDFDLSENMIKLIKQFYVKDYEKISALLDDSSKDLSKEYYLDEILPRITDKFIKKNSHLKQEVESILKSIRQFQDCLRMREIKIFKNKDYISLYAYLMSHPSTKYKTLEYLVRKFGVSYIYPYDKWSPDVIQFIHSGNIYNHGRRIPKFSKALLAHLEKI